jgi:dTDP-4-dehydrorhamnose reductase
MEREIGVIGAVGFVGQRLCRTLKAAGWKVYGAASSRNEFLLDHVGVERVGERRMPVVINLAYPTGSLALGRREENDRILKRAESLLKPGGHLIHVSTLVVFGVALDRPIECGPVSWKPDHDYVESKVWMEQSITRRFGRAGRLDVLRLGNVWGAASPNWLVGLATRMRADLPVLVRGGRYSNATEVANVVSYLEWLATHPGTTAEPRYHHLAEFSAEPWDRFVGVISETLGIAATSTDAPVARSLGSAVMGSVGGMMFRQLNAHRRAGSWVRRALPMLPESFRNRLRREKTVAVEANAEDDPTLLTVLGCSREFVRKTLPGWEPPVGMDESLRQARAWLEWAGYATTKN